MKRLYCLLLICGIIYANEAILEDSNSFSQEIEDKISQNKDFYTKGFLEYMNLEKGKKVYFKACENCHGVNGDKSLIKKLKDYDEESLYRIVSDYIYDVDSRNSVDSSIIATKQMILDGYSSSDIKNMVAYIKLSMPEN